MSFPTATVLNAGTRMLVGTLPTNAQGFTTSRTPTQYTITNTASVALNATSMQLTASGFVAPATSVLLQQGTVLTFGTTSVTLTADATLTATASTVNITPASATIAMSTTATTYALLQLLGGDSVDFSITDKEVSTRSFENGLFDDARKVMIGGDIPWSGLYRLGDAAITNVIEPASQTAQEIYWTLVYPDGRFRSGAAFIKSFKEGNKLDDIRRLTWNFRVVGTINFGTNFTG